MLRLGRVLVLLTAFALVAASAASAATRYAAPLGTGVDPCNKPAEPCNVYVAADGSAPGTTIEGGDVVELAPGTYSDAAGDLGPMNYVNMASEVIVRGEPGPPRPRFVLDPNSGIWGAFIVNWKAFLSHVEIENRGEGGSAVTIFYGTIDNVIARSDVDNTITCDITEGIVRNSVCLNENGGIALGASIGTSAGTHATTIRNSTAIGTGTGSIGISFAYFASEPGTIATVNAKGLIARGETKDVVARGKANGGSTVGASTTITLENSDYATVEADSNGTGGEASITPAGTNANITAAPLLAPDHIHQLAGSPTINKGIVDEGSALLDIDGQLRTLGPAPDIGADEFANPTKTTLSCSSSSIAYDTGGGEPTCTVRVEDLGTFLTPPSGEVSFSMSPGAPPASCTLAPETEASSTCLISVQAAENALGTQTLTAIYGGDETHDGSQASAVFTRVAASGSGGGGSGGATGSGGGGPGASAVNPPPPVTQLGKHPPKVTKKRLAKFSFGSNEGSAHFQCKLDRKPFKPCSSPFKKKVALGRHKFKVRAVDAQGLVDLTPVVFSWRVVPG